jgi:hypothetical protein
MSFTELIDAVKTLTPSERRALMDTITLMEQAMPFEEDDDDADNQAQDLVDVRSQDGLPTVSLEELAAELGLCAGT